MTESLTELKLEVEKAEPTRVPSETRTIRLEGDVFPKLEARDLGRQSAENEFSEFINFWFKKIDFDTTVKALKILGSEYARSFKFEHSFDGSVHTIIFKHDRGPRTSAFFAEIAKVLFNRLNLKVDAVESDQQLSIIVRN